MTPKTDGFVYVIGTPGSSTVKIGYSKDPTTRLSAIQTASPTRVELLWTHPGNRDLESSLHRYFADRRGHGEWFTFTSDPVDAIRAAVANDTWPEVAPSKVIPAPRTRRASRPTRATRKPGAPPQRFLVPEFRQALTCSLVAHAGMLTGDQIARAVDLIITDLGKPHSGGFKESRQQVHARSRGDR